MSVASKVVTGLTVTGLVMGGLHALAPRSPDELQQDRRQQQVEQLADAEERRRERLREQSGDDADAVRRDRARPGEHRPPIRLRLR